MKKNLLTVTLPAVFLLASCGGGGGNTQPVPSSYSPLIGACTHTGAGWVFIPEGGAAQLIVHVTDVVYCAGYSDANVIPAPGETYNHGKPFDQQIPFTFSKQNPAG